MKDKSNEKKLISGILPGDLRAEIFGDKRTRKIFFIKNGQTKEGLRDELREKLLELLLLDKIAMKDLSSLPLTEAIDEYAFCCYGAIDSVTDVDVEGNIGSVENFSCSTSCRCEKWESKKIAYKDSYITQREMQVLRMLATDYPDKQVADVLKISRSTLDSHKTHLYKKFNVHSKNGLISKAIKNKILEL